MDHTKELIFRAHMGEKEARDRLVLENMGLVHSISRRFLGRGCEAEDINQIGCIGLIKAIDKFDESYDVKFSTYAVPMIAGEIKRFLRDDGMIKVSRSLKENGFRIKKASDRLTAENGREATVEELAAATELSVEDVVMALEANTEVESIYKTVYQGDGSEIYLVDKMTADDSATPAAGAPGEHEKLLDAILLGQLLKELDGMERELIRLRYFKEETQSQVAAKLGISQVQVSRMEKKILVKLRGLIV